MAPSASGRKIVNGRKAFTRPAAKGSSTNGPPRDPSSASSRIGIASSTIRTGRGSSWRGDNHTGRVPAPSFSPALAQPQQMPEQIPVTVGTGHSVINAQRLNDVIGVSG